MTAFRLLAALLALAIAGCGGGGGDGGDSAPSTELSIGTVTPGSINATYSNLNPATGRSVALTASYSGTPSGNVYVVVQDPDAVLSSASVTLGSGSVATLHLVVSQSAAIGRYTAPVVLHVCRDAGCAREYAGFPRTIPKNITIQGTRVNVSALAFIAPAGVSMAVGSPIIVTPPAGADYSYDGSTFLTYTGPNGAPSTMPIGELFSITKTPTGFTVGSKGTWPGHYVGQLIITTPGYANVAVALDYQVDPATTPVVAQLTASVAASGQAGASTDIPVYVEFLRNMGTASGQIQIVATGGSPEPVSGIWIRYYDSSFFTHGAGPENNAERLRFYLNPCFLGSNCLPAGTHTANIVYTASAFGYSTTHIVPVTFTVNP